MSVERVREGEAERGHCQLRLLRARRSTQWLSTATGARTRSCCFAFAQRDGPSSQVKSSARHGRSFVRSTARIRVNMVLILVCGRVKSLPTLVAERFAVKLSLASVGKLLAELGLTPQKPLNARL